jgi:hypothetical protein
VHVACARRRDPEHGRTRAGGLKSSRAVPPEMPLEVLVRLFDEIDEYLYWIKVGISDLIA